jgi:2,4-dienoyl-CoA reductase-like NADH-dependent reductase (Old Yellow Enzyme family)
MCQYSSEDGFANDWHLVHLGSRAVGGSGLIFTEAAAVSPEGRITPHDLGIWKDEHILFLKRITSFIGAHNAIPAIQLAHAGRKASHHRPWEGGGPLNDSEISWQCLAPSSISYKSGEPVPKEMSAEDIGLVVEDFRNAAIRALTAGFSIIEIHAAHGYLIHSFLSPLSNSRKDQYGGSFENRIRILLQITEAVRSVWTEDKPLFVRISASDWDQQGWTIEDSIELAKILKNKQVDLIDCSSGGLLPSVKIPVGPLYQTGFAERIKKEAGIMTGAVGMITSADEAESIIDQKADLVFMARQMLREPYFPLHAARQLGAEISWPVQYERAKT